MENEVMSFDPCQDRVVIAVPERKSKTGIILPETVEKSLDGKKALGRISAIGPDVQDQRLVVGTMVMYNPAEALPLTIAGKKYFIVYEGEILGICKPVSAN